MEKEKTKISIIVPVYNVEKYIRDCLDSLINQTYHNIEIILVDDGSTDSSGNICDEYGKNDKRIIVIHKNNGGLVSARKAGIEIATGEYITYVDSDDWIDITAYEELINVTKGYSPDIISYDFIKEYPKFNTERIQPLKEGFYKKKQFFEEIEKCIKNNDFFCPGTHISLWTKLFRNELLRKYQLSLDEKVCMGEDAAVVFPSVLNMNDIYIAKKSFYHYRVRENSITRSRADDEYYRYLKLVEALNAGRDVTSEWREKIDSYLIYLVYYFLIICVPQYCFGKGMKFFLFPEVKQSDHIIIYGKGVFADGIKKYMEQTSFCTIIDNMDRTDIARIENIPEESYQFVIVAITDFAAVRASKLLLEKMGIDKNKILHIQKENLLIENLPLEVRKILGLNDM